MKLLYISNALPYDGIRHAGGKTFNYYVKQAAQQNQMEIKVISLCKSEEICKIDSSKYGFDCRYVCSKGGLPTNIKRVLVDIFGICTFRNCCGQSYFKTLNLLKEAYKVKEEGFIPDVVILEWTNIVLMVSEIKKIFPKSKLIASEHDVSFLGAERKYLRATGAQRAKLEKRYTQLKEDELGALLKCDVVMPQNIKDKNLLINNDIPEEKIFVLTPYYHNMSYIKRENINHDILFWGAMYRPENYEAAIWFIDKVMPLLKDTDIRFVVAGNRPPKELTDKSSDRVAVTGFVEDETPYFSHSLCFVSPLLTGAGIKVKVIEALSAGIPILTNDIGIEGIPAVDKESYFNCASPVKYAEVIKKLLNNEIDSDKIRTAQTSVISDNFDLNMSTLKYIDMIKGLETDDCREN